MKTFDDLNSYYPLVNKPNIVFDDFIIIRYEEMLPFVDINRLKGYSLPHRRNFFEISIGIKETSSPSLMVGKDHLVSVDNNLVFAAPGQMFSISFNEYKKIKNDKGFIIAFKPSFMIKRNRNFQIIERFRFFNSFTYPQYVLDYSQLKTVLYLLDRIDLEYKNGEDYAREVIMGLLDVLLHNFKRLLTLNFGTINPSSSMLISNGFEQKIIEDGTKLATIKNYASRLNVSPNYLSKVVKKVTGKNAMQVLLSHKLIVAKSLLQESEKSIAEIADEMGFSESTNFTKFFKQITGQTPSQFRK